MRPPNFKSWIRPCQHLTYSRGDIEEFEDTKRAFRINPQIEGQTTQWPKQIKTNNDQQNTTQKTKDLATRPH